MQSQQQPKNEREMAAIQAAAAIKAAPAKQPAPARGRRLVSYDDDLFG